MVDSRRSPERRKRGYDFVPPRSRAVSGPLRILRFDDLALRLEGKWPAASPSGNQEPAPLKPIVPT